MKRSFSCLASLLAGLLWCASSLHAAPAIDVVTTDIGPLIDEAAKHPNRFAVEVVHPASPDSKGVWSSSGADRRWTYTVQVPTAISMSLHATTFQLPPSATLTVAGSQGKVAYRQADASRTGLWTRPLIGDKLTLSLTVAAAEASEVHLQIQTLQAGYRSLGAGVENHPRLKRLLAAKDATAAGSCTENYSCHMTGANTGPAAATVAIIVANVGQCTGTLLTNVRADTTPYILTARHCENGDLAGGQPEAAGNVMVVWDAVSPCGSTLGSLYAPGLKTQSGAVTVVEQQDVWLIKLDSPVAADDAYYAGWDATGGVFTGGYSVHHALGLDKQYVEWSGQSILETIPGSTLKVGYDSKFWGLVNAVGSGGAGASGGAVFDSNNNVVGSASLAALVGGEGTAGVCPVNPVPAPSPSSATAFYTSLAAVWSSTADTTSSTGNVTLQSVLDPDGTGRLVAAGYGLGPMTLTSSNPYPNTLANTTLTWNAPGTDSCTASGGTAGDGWNGAKPASGSTQVNEGVGGDVVYSINCVGKSLVTHASVRLTWTYIAPYVELHSVQPGPVMAGGIVYLSWTSNVSPCTATGGLNGDGWSGAKTTPSSGNGFQNITANQIGTVTYGLTCGSGSYTATSQLPVSVVAPGVTLYADTTRITAAAGASGSYVNLHWVGSGTGGNNCVSSGGSPGDGWNYAANNGATGFTIISESVPGTYTYAMTCTGGGQTATSSVSVQFTNEAPAASLTAIHPTQEIYPATATNDQVTPDLVWTSNINGCSLASLGPDSTSLALQGQYPGGTASAVAHIAGHYVYTLYCPGSSLQASATIDWVTSHPQITMNVPTTSWIANIPYPVSYSANTTPCVESGGVPGDGWGGSGTFYGGNTVTETAPGTYTFIVTCGTGSSTTTAQVVATIAPPGVTISSSVANVPVGQPFTLMWDSSIAPCTSVVAGSVNWGGSLVYPNGTLTEYPAVPGTYTYSITCGSGSQTVNASTQIVVSAQVPTAITANVVSAGVSAPVVLTWTAPASAACTASGGDGLDGWGGPIPSSGSATVTGHQASQVAYQISCSGLSASAFVTYTNATAAAAPRPSASLSADTSDAVTGHSVTLDWNAENSTQCLASGGNSTDDWSGSLPTSGSRSVTESTDGSYTYIITCTGAPPASMAKVTVKYSGATGSAGGGSGNSSGGSGGGGGAFVPFWLWLLLIPATLRGVSRFRAFRGADEGPVSRQAANSSVGDSLWGQGTRKFFCPSAVPWLRQIALISQRSLITYCAIDYPVQARIRHRPGETARA